MAVVLGIVGLVAVVAVCLGLVAWIDYRSSRSQVRGGRSPGDSIERLRESRRDARALDSRPIMPSDQSWTAFSRENRTDE